MVTFFHEFLIVLARATFISDSLVEIQSEI